ncbi:MAG: UDP-N-acetylmuramate dehydrogenase [Desulfomonilaceae bacterium]
MILTPLQIKEIEGLAPDRVFREVPLRRFTSFKIGGPADLMVEPAGLYDLSRLLMYLRDEKIPRIVLGAGTNVLFHDAGFRGVVIRTKYFSRMDFQSDGTEKASITVSAGVPLSRLVSRACEFGWTGIEDLWGIPGSFGGAVVTNAGAGNVSMFDPLVMIRLLNDSGEPIAIEKKDLRSGYRSMEIPPGSVLVEGILQVERADSQEIDSRIAAARERRRNKQPSGLASAGCVFKNPSQEKPAGLIIERLGLKGMAVGDAQISEIHANFIVNCGKARAADVLELIEKIRTKVMDEEALKLDLEIRVLGQEGLND